MFSSVKSDSKTSFHLKIFNITGNILQHLGSNEKELACVNFMDDRLEYSQS